MDNWTVPFVRYSGPPHRLDKGVTMNHRTRTLMTLLKVLHPRDNIDRLYQRKEEKDSSEFRIAFIQQFWDSKKYPKIKDKNNLG